MSESCYVVLLVDAARIGAPIKMLSNDRRATASFKEAARFKRPQGAFNLVNAILHHDVSHMTIGRNSYRPFVAKVEVPTPKKKVKLVAAELPFAASLGWSRKP